MCLCAMKLILYHFHVHKHCKHFTLRQLLFNKNQNLFDKFYWINFKKNLLFIIRCNVDLCLCAMIEMWWWNLKPGKYIRIICFQSLTYAAQKKKSVYTTNSTLVPRPGRAIRVSGRVLEPSLTRLTGDVTFETAKDERERGKYQPESKSVWMTKIKHKFTFGGSLPSSIMRVSPLFTCEFPSVSSYELKKKRNRWP